jgi:hypothetical protein
MSKVVKAWAIKDENGQIYTSTKWNKKKATSMEKHSEVRDLYTEVVRVEIREVQPKRRKK